MMSEILEIMFNNLITYFWFNPNDDNDCGALLIASENLEVVIDITESVSDTPKAETFGELKRMLISEDIEFFDLSDSVYAFSFMKE